MRAPRRCGEWRQRPPPRRREVLQKDGKSRAELSATPPQVREILVWGERQRRKQWKLDGRGSARERRSRAMGRRSLAAMGCGNSGLHRLSRTCREFRQISKVAGCLKGGGKRMVISISSMDLETD